MEWAAGKRRSSQHWKDPDRNERLPDHSGQEGIPVLGGKAEHSQQDPFNSRSQRKVLSVCLCRSRSGKNEMLVCENRWHSMVSFKENPVGLYGWVSHEDWFLFFLGPWLFQPNLKPTGAPSCFSSEILLCLRNVSSPPSCLGYSYLDTVLKNRWAGRQEDTCPGVQDLHVVQPWRIVGQGGAGRASLLPRWLGCTRRDRGACGQRLCASGWNRRGVQEPALFPDLAQKRTLWVSNRLTTGQVATLKQ